MVKIQGEVARVLCYDDTNGFTAILLQDELLEEIKVVGTVDGPPWRGDTLCAEAEWEDDLRYGRQYRIQGQGEIQPPKMLPREDCIRQYLQSEVSGVGRALAERIVETFGEQTADVMDNEPEWLLDIQGVGEKELDEIMESWRKGRSDRGALLFLLRCGVNMTTAKKICALYGGNTITMVRANPYRLIDEIEGIGFLSADLIARKLGTAYNADSRIRGGIRYKLNQLRAEGGHCYAIWGRLPKDAARELAVREETVLDVLYDMQDKGELELETGLLDEGDALVYLPKIYEAECGVAERVARMARENVPPAVGMGLAAAGGVQYNPEQQKAICTALTNRVMVLTGGPGTGKTTVIKGIIKAFQAEGKTVLLAAPTGRAAKRMEAVTGLEAKTIHRLLECGPATTGRGGWAFKRNRHNPLEGDVLIVDECSMVDLPLMYSLLDAVPDGMTVILVGDADQLPSVGPGNVLKDIIDSDVVTVVRLEYNFRQAQGSGIIENAHRINQGQMINLYGGRGDFLFCNIPDPYNAAECIVRLCKERLPACFGVDALRDIQVLSPTHKGAAGTKNLNRRLQNELNPNPNSIRKNGTEFRLYDKVMQTSNDYEKDVFNGDIGVISDINTRERTLTVKFEGDNDVDYNYDELDDLTLAYATTVHKAQGGEFPIVVIPLVMEHGRLLQRNLLYTGVTRATKAVVLVGDETAVYKAIGNSKMQRRKTMLAQRLKSKACCGQKAV